MKDDGAASLRGSYAASGNYEDMASVAEAADAADMHNEMEVVKAKTMFEVRWSSLSVFPAAGDFWT